MRQLIKTTDQEWLKKALNSYAKKTPFDFLDDAGVGITGSDLESAITLVRAARDTGAVTWQKIGTILTGLGMSSAGIWMIWLAMIDPEPSSRLTILLAGGVLMALTGSLSILLALGQKWRVAVKTGKSTIAVEPG